MIRERGESKIKYDRRDDHILFCGLRIVNFRPLLLAALSFGGGIAAYYFLGLYSLFFLTVLIPIGCICLIRKMRSKHTGSALPAAAVFCCLFLIGSFSLGMRIAQFDRLPNLDGVCYVLGTVDEIGVANETQVYTISDLTIVDRESGEINPGAYKLRVYVYQGEEELALGDRVAFSAEVTTIQSWEYGKLNASSMLEKIRYRAFAEEDAFQVEGKTAANVFNQIDLHLRNTIYASMETNNASIAYAMITGNSGFMDDEVLQNFRYGGVAHIFAVSGLHIGVVYGVLTFFLKRLNIHKWLRFFVVSIFLFLYVGICGFSPSSVRAFIMCLVLLASDVAGFQYDRLNSVSVASFAVLVINPLYLFSVGFQLSVAAAGGIVVLGGHLSRKISRIPHIRQSVASAVGTALSAQICTFPILLDCFGYVSAISFFLNLLFIPLISAVYAVLFVCCMAAAIIPIAGSIILFIPEYLLQIAVLPIMMLEFDTLLIAGFSFGGAAVIWYLIIWLLSDKINFRVWVKAAGAFLLSILMVAMMCTQNLAFYDAGILSLHGYYGSNFVVYRESENTAIISYGVPDADHVERVLLREGIHKIDVLITIGSARDVNTAVPVFLEYASIDDLYISADSSFVNSFHSVRVRRQDGFFSMGKQNFDFVNERVLYMNFDGADILFIRDDAQSESGLPQCDVMIAEKESDLAQECMPAEEIYFERALNKLSIQDSGDIELSVQDEKVIIKEA